MYKFVIPIGDWSEDGHGKHDDYVVTSNKPVEAVREAHYRILAATGVNLSDICNEYGEDYVKPETVKQLKALGFTFDSDPVDNNTFPTPTDMVKLWAFLLKKADPTLELDIEFPEDYEMLTFCGFDDQGRHIDAVGYGIYN